MNECVSNEGMRSEEEKGSLMVRNFWELDVYQLANEGRRLLELDES